ncbi:MAG: response regulator transcription factor [Bacteroidota bacterium]
MPSPQYTVSLVDDHQVLLDGLSAVLGKYPQWQVLHTATRGEDCLQQLEQAQPDLLLMDLQMPGMGGLAFCEAVKKQWPTLPVLVLSMEGDGHAIRQAIEKGANGYILKEAPKEELLQAMEIVRSGGSYHSAEVSQAVMASLQPRPGSAKVGGIEIRLTKREKEILRLIVAEHSTPEIAEALFISENTVETHRKNLMSKLQVRNLAGLVKYALQHGLVE